MYAIGNNRETAKILGLPVSFVRIFAFCFSGLLSAMAGSYNGCKDWYCTAFNRFSLGA